MSVLPTQVYPVFTVAVWLTLAAAVVSWGVAAYAWRYRPAAGAGAMTALTAATGWWALGYVIELSLVDLEAKLLLANLQWMGVLLGPVAWVAFAFSYTGRDQYATPPSLIALSVLPAIGIVAVWTNPAHHLMWSSTTVVPAADGAFSLLKHEWGPLYWALLGYGYLLWFTGAVLLVQTAFDLPAVYRLQATTIVVGALLPLVGNVATMLLELYGAALDVTPAAFAGAGIACTVALTRYDLLEVRPVPRWVARERVLEEMADVVVVTDTRWRVTELNAAAKRLLGDGDESLKGTPIRAVVPGFSPDDRSEADPVVETLSVATDGGQRYFELRASEVTDFHGRPVGHAIVLRDVTDRRHYLQRLEVMNRVLRHNLRTEANILHGYADLVVSELEGGDGESARRYAEMVRDSALDLSEISQKARKLDDMVDERRAAIERDTAPVSDQIRAAVADVTTQFPAARVRVGALPDPTVECSMTLVPILRELVENGVEHDPEDRPLVTVWATVEESELVVRVADHGPGIHPEEVDAIRSDVETPLHHGSGLGLWLVTWGVNSLGGCVRFDANDRGGTVVTLRIPGCERADAGEDSSESLTEAGPDRPAADCGP
jgi:PAS domain S-box-containing protein